MITLVCLLACSVNSCSVSSKLPRMAGYKVWNVAGVEFNNSDFSAITKTFDGKRFVGAFNSAGLYYIEVPSEGETVLVCSPLWAYGAQFSEGARDMEGLAVDRRNGDIYFSQERATKVKEDTIYQGNTIYRLRYPNYSSVETVHNFGSEYFAKDNYTIEGFTWVGKGKFLLGREGNPKKAEYPAAIMKYSPGEGITDVAVVSDWTKQVAGMEYDSRHKWLWILDGDYDKVLHIVKAKNFKPVATVDLSFIKNAEGICLDYERGCVWITSDETPSKLYRLDFIGL